jgi:hypothetical protein
MKTSSLARSFIAASSFLGASFASAQVTVSNVTAVPGSNVTINQSSFSDASSTQARDNASGIRSVTQTFTWNSTLALDGVGLRLAAAQDTLDPVAANRVWHVDIQQISSTGILPPAASVQSTVASLTFTLTPEAVAPSSYLYLDLTNNLTLTNGMTYGMIIYAGGAGDPAQRLFFSRSADASAYSGGIAAQNTYFGAGPYNGTYGGAGYSLGFYMTTAAIPEPGTTAALMGAGAALCVVAVRLRRRRS